MTQYPARRPPSHALTAVVLALSSLALPKDASADKDWFDPATWPNGTVPTSGDAANIGGGERVMLSGAGAVYSLSISNNVWNTNVSSLVVSGNSASLTGSYIQVGVNGGSGALTLNDQAWLNTASLTLASTLDSSGSATVDNSRVTAGSISIAGSGTATFYAQKGSTVNVNQTILGEWGKGNGTLVISDGSTWNNSARFSVGTLSSGTVKVLSAGVLSTTSGATLGGTSNGAASGSVLVRGNGSEWRSGGTVTVGEAATGKVWLLEGGSLSAPKILIANQASSKGQLLIGGEPGSPAQPGGRLDVGAIEFGAGAGTLIFNLSGSPMSYAGTLAGPGQVRVLAGNLVYTGNSAAAISVLGDPRIFVEGGTLDVRGQLRGQTSVLDGGRLGGNGAVGATQISAGGRLAPSGTLTVNGDLSLSPNAVYEVRAAPDGTASRVVVNGLASLAGSVLHVGPDGEFAPYQRYTIMQAQTLAGAFDSVSSNFAYLTPSISYSGQDVLLELRRSTVTNPNGPEPIRFSALARTPNQRSVAQALESLPVSNDIHQAVLTLPAGAPPAALAQLAGEPLATTASALGGLAVNARSLPMAQLRRNLNAAPSPGAPTASAGTSDAPISAAVLPDRGTSPMWAQLVGQWQTGGGEDGIARFRQHTGGVFAGADGALASGWRLGAAVGVSNSKMDVGSLSSRSDIDSYSATVYAGRRFDSGAGSFNVLLGVGYTWHDIASQRHVQFAGVDQKLSANYGASTGQVFAELGYGLPVGGRSVIEPYVGLAFNDQRVRAFSETGGSAALRSERQHDQTTTTTLGLRASTTVDDLTLSGGAGWRHALGDLRPQSRLAFADSAVFTVAGAPIAANALVTELGLSWQASRSLALSLRYDGEYGGGNKLHTGMLRAAWAF
ncbi:autotransporter family protein [Bordetella avium]|uniref:autotransporter family protein n=1 Tax=Bordetella avium TaxID=521 RepID=UPI000E17ABDC|nr:autotransporter outer membrane beta-barrel domain-containing protein [Bordetella avium]WQE33739.1 autotransporter domain-containing protein [Bordetella avium]SUV67305.1 autotransporter [Bordetella avium]